MPPVVMIKRADAVSCGHARDHRRWRGGCLNGRRPPEDPRCRQTTPVHLEDRLDESFRGMGLLEVAACFCAGLKFRGLLNRWKWGTAKGNLANIQSVGPPLQQR